MSWKSLLATGIGIGLAPFTGGLSIPIASAAGQAWEAHDAAGKATKQVQQGYQQGVNVLQPYNARGNAAGDTLAGYLGIDVPQGGFAGAPAGGVGVSGLPLTTPGQSRLTTVSRDLSNKQQAEAGTLADFFLKTGKKSAAQDVVSPRASMSRPQSPSAKSSSSYRAEEN